MSGSLVSFRRHKTGLSAIPIIFWTLFSVGCETPPTVDHSSARTAPPTDSPTYAEIAELNNHRVSQLQKTYSYGVLELRWEDERGIHAEPQVNVEMWFDLPDLSAIRVDKLGEVFFWAGSDERRFWAFSLLDKNDKAAIIRGAVHVAHVPEELREKRCRRRDATQDVGQAARSRQHTGHDAVLQQGRGCKRTRRGRGNGSATRTDRRGESTTEEAIEVSWGTDTYGIA